MNSINIHPIFVHFPIAFLCLYTFFEVVRLPILTRQSWWIPVKSVLLFAGMIGGFAALETGELAESGFEGTTTMTTIRLHETFANAAIYVYGILAILYVIEWLHQTDALKQLPLTLQKAWKFLEAPLLIVGSLAGFMLITITGALGGAIVYGPDVDPVVSFIYHLFLQ